MASGHWRVLNRTTHELLEHSVLRPGVQILALKSPLKSCCSSINWVPKLKHKMKGHVTEAIEGTVSQLVSSDTKKSKCTYFILCTADSKSQRIISQSLPVHLSRLPTLKQDKTFHPKELNSSTKSHCQQQIYLDWWYQSHIFMEFYHPHQLLAAAFLVQRLEKRKKYSCGEYPQNLNTCQSHIRTPTDRQRYLTVHSIAIIKLTYTLLFTYS